MLLAESTRAGGSTRLIELGRSARACLVCGMESNQIEEIVLDVSHRNGGKLGTLDWEMALMAPELKIDSMDLAEIVARLERVFHVSPFDAEPPPRTWGQMRDVLVSGGE